MKIQSGIWQIAMVFVGVPFLAGILNLAGWLFQKKLGAIENNAFALPFDQMYLISPVGLKRAALNPPRELKSMSSPLNRIACFVFIHFFESVM
jgi:hypothetical protein